MTTNKIPDEIADHTPESDLDGIIKKISNECIRCNKCLDECGFIRKHGKPKDIADKCNAQDSVNLEIAFECSLCGLCEAVCPAGINPVSMFLEMRREAVKKNNKILKKYSGLLAYEKIGTSRRYSWYALPQGGDSIFFPGCTLSGTRPETTFKIYQYLKHTVSNIGIVLDCCTKPSHDLGRQEYFNAMLLEMTSWLKEQGIKHIYAACPNCYKVFRDYAKEFSIHTVYKHIAEKGFPVPAKLSGNITVHDPCVIRKEKKIHASVRSLIKQTGLDITEMPHSGIKTVCCGEGGTVRNQSPELAQNWINIRENENKGSRVITYCAGCAGKLRTSMPSSHILDLLFDPEAVIAGREKVSKPPFTYWNRLRLKKKLKKEKDIVISREREYLP